MKTALLSIIKISKLFFYISSSTSALTKKWDSKSFPTPSLISFPCMFSLLQTANAAPVFFLRFLLLLLLHVFFFMIHGGVDESLRGQRGDGIERNKSRQRVLELGARSPAASSPGESAE